MPARLVSPDCKLFLVDGEGDLKAVAELYKLTSKQLGNIRQLLGEAGVGNGRGDRNDRNERIDVLWRWVQGAGVVELALGSLTEGHIMCPSLKVELSLLLFLFASCSAFGLRKLS